MKIADDVRINAKHAQVGPHEFYAAADSDFEDEWIVPPPFQVPVPTQIS